MKTPGIGFRLGRLGRHCALGLVLLLAPIALAACSANRANQGALGCATAATPCLNGPATVSLQTSKGAVTIQLDGEAAPLTAGNFVDLVKRGAYDGTVFHRVVRDPTPFVVQGGDPTSANPVVPPSQYGTGSYIDPDTGEARLIPLEVKLQDEPSPRYGEPLTAPGVTRQLALAHQRGAVAMARSADPNSASAQFYVALEALPELDGRYAVFGRVSEGMEVIDTIRQGDKITKASLVSGGKLVKGGV
ncbi:peptidyl-prolyl cis-trans isomerase, cyclophilin-type [Cyanobium sp. PCC 7001]|uniref:peptidylprolyl isomerase n=1 Tax=Cyanobium sp. PCC 7001 TaxID=180281 RepID=UPI00018051E7|nr:peptidylprolyl isomerase [Cyanobium sp. PCC 7001]EDY39755.1 peptidyl-prolyl cis-trans isomerase, cyclophilin-type [Cyanobium sp. PCC 7001]